MNRNLELMSIVWLMYLKKNLKLRSKTQIMHMELSIAQYYTGLIKDAKISGKILYMDNMSDGSSQI